MILEGGRVALVNAGPVTGDMLGVTAGGLRLSLSDPGRDAVLSSAGAAGLSARQLRRLVEYADLRASAAFPAASPEGYAPLFRRELARCVSAYRTALREGRVPDASLLREVDSAVAGSMEALRARAGVDAGTFGQALTYRYHDGFNHLLRDDDFICVRRGGRAVEIIPLAGNDRNEIKRFLREAGDRCLSAGNVDDLRAVVREVRKSRAASLVRSLGPSAGLRLRPGED